MRTEAKQKKITPKQYQFNSFLTPKKPRESSSLNKCMPPFISEKMRSIAKNMKESKIQQFNARLRQNEGKVIFKSWLRILNAPLQPQPPSAMNRSDFNIKEIQELNYIMKEKIDSRTAEYKHIGEQFLQICEQSEKNQIKNQTLKKQVKAMEQNKDKCRRFIKYYELLEEQRLQLKQENQNYEINIKQIKAQIHIDQELINKIKYVTEAKQTELKFITNRIEEMKVKWNQQKVMHKQLLMRKLENQSQIINVVFLVGVLSEQIYILTLKKKYQMIQQAVQKKKKSLKQTTDKKIMQNGLDTHLSMRQIVIDSQNSQMFIIFKVFTSIYMHARTLYLIHPAVTMNRISSFSDKFKQIYYFFNFQEYMNVLIERYKNHQSTLIKTKESVGNAIQTHKTKRKLLIVTQERYIAFLKWVLNTFQQQNQNTYFLYLNKSTFSIETVNLEKYREISLQPCKQDLEVSNVLKITFINSWQ